MAAPETKGKQASKTDTAHNQAPQTEIAVIFLGPSPPRRYSRFARGGEYAMLLPAVHEVPPARLFFRDEHCATAAEAWQPLNVSFNNPLPMRQVPAERALWLYRKNSGTDNYDRYVLIPPGRAGEQRVVFLTPSCNARKCWQSTPLVRLISINAHMAEASCFILENLSSTTVLHAFGDNISTLAPGERIIHRQGEAGITYRLAARYGRQRNMIYNTAMRFDAHGGVHLYALYDTDPQTNAGRKVGVFRMRMECVRKGGDSTSYEGQ